MGTELSRRFFVAVTLDRMAASERLGVLGGTFDPPHIGHFRAGLNALESLSLTSVLFVVSNVPWQKVSEREISPAESRLEMVRAGLVGHAGLEASDLELRLGGASYSVRTLKQLRQDRPDAEFFLIVGADAAAGIPTWQHWAELPALTTLAVVGRPGAPIELGFWSGAVVEVDGSGLHVSSTDLRRRVRDGQRLDFLTPTAVIESIQRHGLYRGGPMVERSSGLASDEVLRR